MTELVQTEKVARRCSFESISWAVQDEFSSWGSVSGMEDISAEVQDLALKFSLIFADKVTEKENDDQIR